jgi:hypothetical protein
MMAGRTRPEGDDKMNEVYGCLMCQGKAALWEFLGARGDVFRLCDTCAAAFELGMKNPDATIFELEGEQKITPLIGPLLSHLPRP